MFINEAWRFRELKKFENRLVWHINDYCNFGCSYCFFPKFDKEDPAVGQKSPQEIYEAFKKTGMNWHLFIAGGEPLLYPNFIELVNLLKPEHPIQISTNLYNKNVKKFAEEVSPENIIVINASLHLLHHNDKSLKKFLQNYHLFLDKGFPMAVSYVTYPPLFDRIKEDFEFLKNEGVQYIIPLTFHGMHEGKKYPGNYTYKQIQTISEIYQEPLELLVSMQKMNFENQMCKAGKNYFHMDLHGEVSRCCTIKEESYGNIYRGTFAPAKVPKPCTSNICNDHCHGMMSLIEEPKAPEFGLVGKGYSLLSDVQNFLSPAKKQKHFSTAPAEVQKEFIRLTP